MFNFKEINYEIEKLLGFEAPRQPPEEKEVHEIVSSQFDNPKWMTRPQIPTAIWKDWKREGIRVWPDKFARDAFEADKKMAKMIEQYIKFVENRIREMKKIDEERAARALAARNEAYPPEKAINSLPEVGADLYWRLEKRLKKMRRLMNKSEALYNPSIYKLYKEYEKVTDRELETLLEDMEGED